MDNDCYWFPIYTKSRYEKKVAQSLADQNIEVYLPLNKTLKIWSDRKKWVEEPLIKSYVFVKINLEQQRSQVLMTPGVARFIYFSGKIAIIPEKQIQDLKLLLSHTKDVKIVDHQLEKGEKVTIKAGPLKGLQAEIVQFKNNKSAILRLNNMQCSILLDVHLAHLIDG